VFREKEDSIIPIKKDSSGSFFLYPPIERIRESTSYSWRLLWNDLPV